MVRNVKDPDEQTGLKTTTLGVERKGILFLIDEHGIYSERRFIHLTEQDDIPHPMKT